MKLALIGFPQSGKKTLYSLLTGQETLQGKPGKENEPIPGKAIIRDKRFDKLTDMYKPKKKTPGTIELLLLPDLQNDTSLDNETFRSLKDIDAICCIIRAFKDDSIYHLLGGVDHIRDLKLFLSESLLLDQIFVEKRLERIDKDLKSKNEAQKVKEKELMEKLKIHLEKEKPLRLFPFSNEGHEIIKNYPLITIKPVIIIVNIDESDINNQNIINTLQTSITDTSVDYLPISIKIEQEISQFDSEDDHTNFMNEIGIKEPAINQLTLHSYKVLGLLTYFTVGEDEVRAWMIKKDSTAPRAARAIHEDFERGFIRAEVIKYNDLISLGSEAKVKEVGKLLLKGKDYIVEDGDIIHFLFNV